MDLAREFGARIADRFDLPVYLYARGGAARRPGQARRRAARPVRGPQGRDRAHRPRAGLRAGADAPAAGAVAVGARPFLIAWNINLDSSDVELAKRIARRVRESGGGLPRVQANGFRVEELAATRPRPGLDEPPRLPRRRRSGGWETVRELAAEDGIQLAESELIGLTPLAAFLDVADHAGAPRDADDRGRASPRPPAIRGCATSTRCWRSSCASRPPAPRRRADRPGMSAVRAHRGRSLERGCRRAC